MSAKVLRRYAGACTVLLAFGWQCAAVASDLLLIHLLYIAETRVTMTLVGGKVVYTGE